MMIFSVELSPSSSVQDLSHVRYLYFYLLHKNSNIITGMLPRAYWTILDPSRGAIRQRMVPIFLPG